jgi:hypothetical protein
LLAGDEKAVVTRRLKYKRKVVKKKKKWGWEMFLTRSWGELEAPVCQGLEERKLKAELASANNKMMLCYRLNKIYIVQHKKRDETSKIDET